MKNLRIKFLDALDRLGHDVGANTYDRKKFPGEPSRRNLEKKMGVGWSKLKEWAVTGITPPRKNKTPKGDTSIEKDFKKTSAIITTKSLNIKTLDDALKAANVDISVWEVDRYVINSWEVTMGSPNTNTGNPETYTNFQVKIWLKRKQPEYQAIELLLDQISKKSLHVPVLYSKKKHPEHLRQLELTIVDPHLGLHCFKGGSDTDWSIEKCEQMFLTMLEDLIAASAPYGPFNKIIFPFGNDFMHADNVFNTTTAGTNQPEADAWQHVYLRAEKLGIAAVEKMKLVAPIKIIVIPGNHDRHSAFTLGRILNAYYHNDQNVEVDCTADPYKFHKFGVNLIGFEHGHSVQPLRLASLMANECRTTGWADARYCEWHLGDQHRKGSSKPSMHEEQGVSVEYLPGLTPPNEWHRLKAYNWQKRAGMAFVWDYDRGPIARLQVNIDNYTGEIMGKIANT
jgi:hypothetical protein